MRAQAFARPGKASSEIALVLLDQNSLDWGQQENGLSWPWPRELWAVVSEFCARAGAKAVVLDILYTEPSVYGQSDDEAFGGAVSANGRVVGALFLGEGQSQAWLAGVPDPGIRVEGLPEWVSAARPDHLLLL